MGIRLSGEARQHARDALVEGQSVITRHGLLDTHERARVLHQGQTERKLQVAHHFERQGLTDGHHQLAVDLAQRAKTITLRDVPRHQAAHVFGRDRQFARRCRVEAQALGDDFRKPGLAHASEFEQVGGQVTAIDSLTSQGIFDFTDRSDLAFDDV
jgi:hypothetical protein